MIKVSISFIIWFILILALKIAIGGLMINTVFVITTTVFVLAFVNSIIQIKACNMVLNFKDTDYFAGDTISLKFTLKNRFSLLLTNIVVKSDYFTYFLNCTPFIENNFVRDVTFEKKGIYTMERFNLRIRDVFGVITITKNIPVNKVIYVYPKVVDVSQELKRVVGYQKYETQRRRLKNIIENQQNDIKDFRVFVPGDSLRRVHWKLSAKRGKLFVKEYEQTNESNMNIFVDLAEIRQEKYHEYDDKVASKVVSIINYFVNKGCNIKVFVNDSEKTYIPVMNRKDFTQVLKYFISTKYYTAVDIMDLNDIRRYRSGNNVILIFNPDGKLNIGNEDYINSNLIDLYEMIKGV